MRRGELIANLLFVYGPLVMALLMGLLIVAAHRPQELACLAFYAIGYCLLVLAKVSLFRRGVWISWGPSQMSLSNRQMYVAAYGLMGIGFLLNALFAIGLGTGS